MIRGVTCTPIQHPVMPIVHRKESEFYQLAVWHSSEPESDLQEGLVLSTDEKKALLDTSSSTRRREILTVRRLLNDLTSGKCKISYSPTGKPILDDGSHISISHSKDKVAMIISPGFQVGIDIEAFRPQIRNLSSKFVSDEERNLWGPGLTDEALHLIWGAKEVLFKLYSKGGVDFKADLFIEPAGKQDVKTVSARFRKAAEHFDAEVHFELLDGFMMAWSIRS